MIASHNPRRTRLALAGVNVVRLRDGREVHLDDIATADEGQRLLDETDGALLSIEGQLDRDDGRDPEWRSRAEAAHKKTRRIRPALQRRIAELRRTEREAAAPPAQANPSKDARRKAFVTAAEQMLDHELFTEIWQRASESDPVAFEGWGGVQG